MICAVEKKKMLLSFVFKKKKKKRNGEELGLQVARMICLCTVCLHFLSDLSFFCMGRFLPTGYSANRCFLENLGKSAMFGSTNEV